MTYRAASHNKLVDKIRTWQRTYFLHFDWMTTATKANFSLGRRDITSQTAPSNGTSLDEIKGEDRNTSNHVAAGGHAYGPVFYGFVRLEEKEGGRSYGMDEEYVPYKDDPGYVCYSEECINAGSTISSNMDLNVNPCKDFHKFACGGYENLTTLPPGVPYLSAFDVAADALHKKLEQILDVPTSAKDPATLRKAKAFYKACQNEAAIDAAGIGPLLNLLDKDLGGFPMITKDWQEKNYDYMRAAAAAFVKGGIGTISLEPHPEASREHIITFWPASLNLPAEFYCNSESGILDAYRNLLVRVAIILRDTKGATEPTEAEIEGDARELINFEIELAKLTCALEVKYEEPPPFLVVDLKDIAKTRSNDFNWAGYIIGAFRAAGFSLDHNEPIMLKYPQYFREIEKIQLKRRTLANFISWRVVFSVLPLLTTQTRKAYSAYTSTLRLGGLPEPDRKWECTEYTARAFDIAVTSAYAKKHFPLDLKREVEHHVETIKASFFRQIKSLSWMSSDTKERTKEKLLNMDFQVAYPSWILDQEEVRQYYKDLSGDPTDFLKFVINHYSPWSWNQYASQLRNQFELKDWVVSPLEVNAFNLVDLNRAVICVGLLQPPFFWRDIDVKALDYGPIGMIVGHEITHGLSIEGRFYNAFAIFDDFWTPDTLANFRSLQSGLKEQYSRYTLPFLGWELPVNGSETAVENAADNGGSNQAFIAYENFLFRGRRDLSLSGLENFTPEQLFFITQATWKEVESRSMGRGTILAAVVLVAAIVAIESRFIQHPKERVPDQRSILLRDFLAKQGKNKENVELRQPGIKTPGATRHNVPVFHPDSKSPKHHVPVPKPKKAPAKPKHPLLKSRRKPLLTKQQEICQTPECQESANRLLGAMDLTANPCQDFFQYSCGNWVASHPIPSTASSISVFNELRDNLSNRLREILEAQRGQKASQALNNAKNLYESCIDLGTAESLGVQPLLDELNSDYTGWPMTQSTWDETVFNPVTVFTNLLTKGGTQSLATIYVLPDDFNTDQTIIYMDQGSLGLPRDFFLVPELSVILDAYKALLTGTAKVVRDATSSGVTDAQIEADVNDVIAFETTLAEILTPDEDRQNYTALYNKMTIPELQAISGNTQLDWKTIFDALFATVNVEIAADESLVVQAPEYIEKFFNTFAGGAISSRTVANYLSWRYVYGHAELTSQAMRDLFFQFDQVVAGITEPQERWLTCSNLVNNVLGFAVSGPYVSQYFPPAAKEEMLELIANLRVAFDEIIDNLTWMDASTKERAKTKLEAMREFVAYPDWILDDAAVDAFYDGLTAVPAALFQNIYSYDSWSWNDMAKTLHVPTNRDFYDSWSWNDMAKTLHVPTNRDLWITQPSIVNAFFYPSMNSITFPAGILQPPFFQSNSLQSLNYGGIGVVIGHEMTHGFDNNGRQFDELGNLINWWTPATGDAFVEKAQCFINQYTNYLVPELDSVIPEAHLDGLQTLGENLADNGGMRQAWNAYLRYKEANGAEPVLPGLQQFTPEQLFFINFGNLWCGHYTQAGLLNIVLNDEHSPGKYRVWGSCSNSEPFAEAFGCTPEDDMFNGENLCQIW
ncbi:unnamed protein product [Notodromas monacha]|uniref:Endothelin-converting enzyme 1 n=1 Tax=Notodromas monacha TaxID=399045 RepID=A0A7R9BQY1_9CRUS|nr:unnamed protein product [Notodromas monacha]CAG0918695.1 unnamed protein product [Notodromas monacha]